MIVTAHGEKFSIASFDIRILIIIIRIIRLVIIVIVGSHWFEEKSLDTFSHFDQLLKFRQ